MVEKRLLTHEERAKIWRVIGSKMNDDDKNPEEVIKDSFNGDENAYLLVMARWHNIPLARTLENS